MAGLDPHPFVGGGGPANTNFPGNQVDPLDSEGTSLAEICFCLVLIKRALLTVTGLQARLKS